MANVPISVFIQNLDSKLFITLKFGVRNVKNFRDYLAVGSALFSVSVSSLLTVFFASTSFKALSALT